MEEEAYTIRLTYIFALHCVLTLHCLFVVSAFLVPHLAYLSNKLLDSKLIKSNNQMSENALESLYWIPIIDVIVFIDVYLY